MSPRTGRPPIDNPKKERITVRLDDESSTILNIAKKKVLKEQKQ